MFRHEKVFALERNCIVGQKPYNINFFSFRIRNFVTPIIESVRTPARITPYPTERLFWGGAIPGTSCQATIASSLRDISQQALEPTRCGWLAAYVLTIKKQLKYILFYTIITLYILVLCIIGVLFPAFCFAPSFSRAPPDGPSRCPSQCGN